VSNFEMMYITDFCTFWNGGLGWEELWF